MLSQLVLITTALASQATAGKRGLVWPWFNENTALDPAAVGNGQVSYMYNYETWRPSRTGSLNFIGTQRCYPTCDSSPVAQLATRARQQGWTDVFTVNEPDLAGYSPVAVAAWYRQYVEPLTIRKFYPSVSSSGNSGQGLDWLNAFIDNCRTCYHDGVGIHWYGHSAAEFRSYIQTAHNRLPGELLAITEFALVAPATQADQLAFFRSTMPWLDQQSYVTYYFPFIATSPSLFSANDPSNAAYVGTGSCLYNNGGSLSPIGQAVIS